jgi:diguanylate cyclase (GGDEF)-like protein
VRLPHPKPLYRYLLAVSVLGLGVLAAVMSSAVRMFEDPSSYYVLFFLLVVLGELLPIKVPRRDAEITTSTTFAFAALLSGGLPAAAVAQATGSLITDLARRRSPWRSAFNVAQYTLSYAAAYAVLSALSNVPHPGGEIPFGAGDVPAMIAAALAFFLVNNGLAGAASALADDASVLPQLLDDFAFQASTAAVLLGLAPIVVVVAHFSLVLIPLMLLPLGAVYLGGWQAALNDHEALHDPLTGLPNRAYFRVNAEQAVRAREREDGRLALMVMDLDRFKEINDGLGHRIGDVLLREIGPRLGCVLDEACTVARLGGDEFAVLVPRVHGPGEAVKIAENLTAALESGFGVEGLELEVGASIGIACWPEHGEDVDTLMRHADAAMYQAKQSRSGHAIYRSLHGSASRDPLEMGAELRRAIQSGQLEVHYQPQVQLNTGVVLGVEALARWEHPLRGQVSPGDFIPLAEATGLIRTLTMSVLDSALAQWRLWRSAGIDVELAVNLSAGDLLDGSLPAGVQKLLERWSVPAERLTLEVTESTVIADSRGAGEVLARLSALGVRLSIDDFGTGYSSMSYLRTLPVNEVKIDRSFVTTLDTDDRDRLIVSSVVDLAHRLGLRAVAEGAESVRTLDELELLGCDLVQGFQLARPMPGADIEAWMNARELPVPKAAVVGEPVVLLPSGLEVA